MSLRRLRLDSLVHRSQPVTVNATEKCVQHNDAGKYAKRVAPIAFNVAREIVAVSNEVILND